jgi:hypothetical protein
MPASFMSGETLDERDGSVRPQVPVEPKQWRNFGANVSAIAESHVISGRRAQQLLRKLQAYRGTGLQGSVLRCNAFGGLDVKLQASFANHGFVGIDFYDDPSSFLGPSSNIGARKNSRERYGIGAWNLTPIRRGTIAANVEFAIKSRLELVNEIAARGPRGHGASNSRRKPGTGMAHAGKAGLRMDDSFAYASCDIFKMFVNGK